MTATERLRHYASKPVNLNREVVYTQHVAAKPQRLWVSIDGEWDWPSWCRDSGYRVDRLATEHEVTLAPSARILRKTTASGIDAFHDRYHANPHWLSEVDDPHWAMIDWPAVAQDHDGIIISPYQWSRRSDGPLFYYGWDCASGCVWNLDAIAGFKATQAVSA